MKIGAEIQTLGGLDLTIAVCERQGYSVHFEQGFNTHMESRLYGPGGRSVYAEGVSDYKHFELYKWKFYSRAVDKKSVPCYHGDIKAALSLVCGVDEFALWIGAGCWCATFDPDCDLNAPDPGQYAKSIGMNDPQTAVCRAFLLLKAEPE